MTTALIADNDHDAEWRAARGDTVLRSAPHSLEAEQAVLGGILFDNDGMERVEAFLRPSHFFEPFHQRLFEAMVTMSGLGRLIEPVVLLERFKDDPACVDLGGLKYLADLMNRAPPAAHVGDYGRVVYGCAVRRDLIRAGGDIAKAAMDDRDAEPDALLEWSEAVLFGLSERGPGASSAMVSFDEAAASAIDAIARAYAKDGTGGGIPTGLMDLDRKLGGGLYPSDLIILAGRPSMGKTSLATNIAFRLAKAYREVQTQDGNFRRVAGAKVGFWSLEMSKEQLTQRMLSEATGIPSDRMRKGDITAAEFGLIKDAYEEIRAIPLHLDPTGGIPVGKLAAKAKRHKRKHGLDLIIVDYLQLVTSSGKPGQNRVQEVSEVTSALKALAKDLDVPVIALSQLSRKVEERDDKRPQLADLRESGSIEQDADAVLFVYREAYYLGRAEPAEGSAEHMAWQDRLDEVRNQADVIIGKQRHGPIGSVKLAFNEDLTRFGDLAREAAPHWSDER